MFLNILTIINKIVQFKSVLLQVGLNMNRKRILT